MHVTRDLRITVLLEEDLLAIRSYWLVTTSLLSGWWALAIASSTYNAIALVNPATGELIERTTIGLLYFVIIVIGAVLPRVVYNFDNTRRSAYSGLATNRLTYPSTMLLAPTLLLLFSIWGVAATAGGSIPVLALIIAAAGHFLHRCCLYALASDPIVLTGASPYTDGLAKLLSWVGFTWLTGAFVVVIHRILHEPVAEAILDIAVNLLPQLAHSPEERLVGIPIMIGTLIVLVQGSHNTASLTYRNQETILKRIRLVASKLSYIFLIRP